MSKGRQEGRRDSDPFLGQVIDGRYRVVERIAVGGMARVYRAEQLQLKREVALKLLQLDSLEEDKDGDEFCRRFFVEAATAAKLRHQNTVAIFDYGHTGDDLCYIAMELVRGRTLEQLLRERGSLPPLEALAIAEQICKGLREAHALGVVHRDLKPSNVLLARHGDERDHAKVADFGLAKNTRDPHDLTLTGRFMGSPKYASPEQVRGVKVDARSDIYALGVILYRMLSGHVPFDRVNDFATLLAHAREPVPRLTLDCAPAPEPLRNLVSRCLAKQPQERFPNVDELLCSLRGVQRVLRPVSSAPPSQPTTRSGRASMWSAMFRKSGAALDDATRQYSVQDAWDSSQPAWSASSRGRATVRWKGAAAQRRAELRRGILGSLTIVACVLAVMWMPASTHAPDEQAQLKRPQPSELIQQKSGPTSKHVEAASRQPAQEANEEPETWTPVTLSPRRTPSTATRMVQIEVQTRPASATLWLDGERSGRGELQAKVPAGRKHTLRIHAPGYRTEVIEFSDAPPPRRIVLKPDRMHFVPVSRSSRGSTRP